MQAVLSFFLSAFMCLCTLCGRLSPAPQGIKTPDCGGGDPVLLPLHGGADPWYYRYGETYYYCFSVGNGVAVRSADSIAGLSTAQTHVVYRAPEDGPFSAEYWAPELHCIDGGWYIYVAADDGNNENHRMYVLEGDSPTGEFRMAGKISDPADKWAIDGTVLQTESGLWFIWSGWETDTDGRQNLYIAPMDSPTHVSGARALLSEPTYQWEQTGMPINEGPEILRKNGAVYLVYSASGSWTDDYCLGILRLTGADPMRPENWVKCPAPAFRKVKTAWGPGHCSFVTSADGKTDYIVYHANEESGTGWSGRSVRIQPFTWIGGIPVFGRPMPAGAAVTLK